MLDQVQQEQLVSQMTRMSFEQLLEGLDSLDPGSLPERYAEVCDAYMLLSLNAHRSHEQDLLLDKLDSSLRMLFGDKGLFVQAGRLMSISTTALVASEVFRGPGLDEQELLLVQDAMTRCSVLSKGGLSGPLPVDAAGIKAHADSASGAAASILGIMDGRGLTAWLNRAKLANLGLARLLEQLASRSAGSEAFDALDALTCGPTPAKEKIQFLEACYRMTGWSSCVAMAMVANERVVDLAGLVREGLGA